MRAWLSSRQALHERGRRSGTRTRANASMPNTCRNLPRHQLQRRSGPVSGRSVNRPLTPASADAPEQAVLDGRSQPDGPRPWHTYRRFMLWLKSRSVTHSGLSCRLTAVAARRWGTPASRLPGGTRDVGGDDVGRVPVQAAAGSVIPHRGARICVRGGLLHVP